MSVSTRAGGSTNRDAQHAVPCWHHSYKAATCRTIICLVLTFCCSHREDARKTTRACSTGCRQGQGQRCPRAVPRNLEERPVQNGSGFLPLAHTRCGPPTGRPLPGPASAWTPLLPYRWTASASIRENIPATRLLPGRSSPTKTPPPPAAATAMVRHQAGPAEHEEAVAR